MEAITNAKTAAALADAETNTITELVIRKKGILRGKGADRKRYGDDLVHVTIRTAFSYEDVLQESILQLDSMTPTQLVVLCADAGLTSKVGRPVTTADAQQAITETRESLRRSLSGGAPERKSFETLTVDGKKISSAKVYTPADPSASDTPAGTIYLQGILILESILQPAENGPAPEPHSQGVPLAKRILRNSLDVGRYVSYTLNPAEPYILKLGGTTPVTSDGHTVRFQAGEIDQVFGISLTN